MAHFHGGNQNTSFAFAVLSMESHDSVFGLVSNHTRTLSSWCFVSTKFLVVVLSMIVLILRNLLHRRKCQFCVWITIKILNIFCLWVCVISLQACNAHSIVCVPLYDTLGMPLAPRGSFTFKLYLIKIIVDTFSSAPTSPWMWNTQSVQDN